MDSEKPAIRYARLRPTLISEAGFTVLELLVSISIIGILASLLLPAILNAREASRRVTCVNQMRQLGFATHNYHDRERHLPRSWRKATQDPSFVYGWLTELLRDIEQTSVRHPLDLERRPVPLVTTTYAESVHLAFLVCPSDITENAFDLFGESHGNSGEESALLVVLPTANYVGVFGTTEADDFQEIGHKPTENFADGSIIHDRQVSFVHLGRGLSHTFLVGERMMATVPSTWLGVDLRGEDAPCRLVGSAMTRPNCEICDECEFTSRHPGGANFAWADGHVTFVTDDIVTETYRQLARRETP